MSEKNKDGKIMDQQSDRFVRTMFCEEVERELRRLGYREKANFSMLFRRWHHAEDMPGIAATERCERALDLRNWLMEDVIFKNFPPNGTHIKGFPKVTFEGLICNIEAHMYMYALSRKGTYNWRSVSTLVAENVFGEISEMESHSNGVPSGESFRKDMAVMAGLRALRMKPNRQFCMQTAKSRAYPLQEVHVQSSDDGDECAFGSQTYIDKIYPRDHSFDQRKSNVNSVVLGTIKSPFEPPRGVKPVRQHYKVDESRLLWSQRCGADISTP